MVKRTGWLLALLLLLTACSGAALDGETELPWQEDFSTPGAWLVETDAAAQVAIEEGVLSVHVLVPNQLAWGAAGRDLGDFQLRVEATQVAGPDDNEYGVLVRMQDADDFYRLSISGDGYFLITKFVEGQAEILGANWTPSAAIQQGQATNVIQVLCQGQELVLVVNGQELARVEDDEFASGDVGLYAGTFYEGDVEIHFDNLQITAPTP